MKISLIALNQEKYPYPVQPIGLAYVAATLLKAGHSAQVVDLCFEANDKALLSEHIVSHTPDVICFSIRNIDSTSFPESIYYLPRIKELVNICKLKSSAVMIAGGSGFSIAPAEILDYLELDLGVVGEGEYAIEELIGRLEEKRSFSHIPGLVFREKESFQINQRSVPLDLDLYSPAREFIDMARYTSEGGITSVQSKRGCHFNCIYCTYPLIEGKMVRMRSPEKVVDELEMLYDRYGVDSFCFVDNVFNFPLDHAYCICNGIIQRGLKIHWTGFFHPRFITPDFAELIKKAGCSGVELGIDSASDKILTTLKKGFSASDVVNAMELCKQVELNTCCCLILGGPGEDGETLKETFDRMDETAPDAILAYSGIRIYPNTEMEKIALDEGYELGNHLEPRFYISETLQESLVPTIQEFAKTHANFIYGGMPNNIPIEFIKRMRKRGVKGPMWELKSKFSKLLINPSFTKGVS